MGGLVGRWVEMRMYSLLFSFVSPPKLLFSHPIFCENMVSGYASSSPMTVGMTYTLGPGS